MPVLKKVIVYREKRSHDSFSVQEQSGDQCFLRKLERPEGKRGLSTSKNEQEEPVKEAGAQQGPGFTAASEHFSPNEH